MKIKTITLVLCSIISFTPTFASAQQAVKCKTVYTNSGNGPVEKTVCWVEMD